MVIIKHCGGLVERIGRDKFDIRKGLDSLLYYGVGRKFGEDNFHEFIIAYLRLG